MKGEKIHIKEPGLIKEMLKREENLSVGKKLAFLNTLANHGIPFEKTAELFLVPHPTAYEWIREWGRYGYDGLASRGDLRTGRPSRLSSEDLKRLEGLLREREFG
jgi:transposase